MAAGKLLQGASSHRSSGGNKAVPCWASLHMDLTQLIAARVLATGDFLDYVRFRAVCSHWRAAAASPHGRTLLDPRFHPRRWMLFPEGFGEYPGHPAHGGHARFFNLSSSAAGGGAGDFVRVPLPELRNHCILDSPDGLLLLQRDEDLAVRLLHPFTREVADLPSIQCLAEQLSRIENPHGDDDSWYYVCLPLVRSVRAAVHVTAATGVVTVMLALERFGRVAFASDGDDEWIISSWKVEEGLDRALAHQGKFYVVNSKHGLTHVSVINPPQPRHEREGSSSSSMAELPPPRTVATFSSEQIHLPSLVELDSEIMLVGYNDPFRSRILVLKLADLVLGKIVPVTSIGDCIIFPGERSLCVSCSWLPSIGSNSVVWLHPGNRSFGQYHLGTGAWSPANDEYLMAGAPTRPCGLINHIFTCCNRRFWNKGYLFGLEPYVPQWQGMQIWRLGA